MPNVYKPLVVLEKKCHNKYKLNSRYYDPAVCRFISAEPNVYKGSYDKGAGLLAYNVFVYCANDPVMYKDVAGESITLAILGVLITVKEAVAFTGLILVPLAAFVFVSGPNFNQSSSINSSIDGLGAGSISASSKKESIADSIGKSFASARSTTTYKSNYETHHIVAQNAPNAWLARYVLCSVGINCNSSSNLVSLKTGLHRRLHTNAYYGWVNSVLISAYSMAGGDKSQQLANVTKALTNIKNFLYSLNAITPF